MLSSGSVRQIIVVMLVAGFISAGDAAQDPPASLSFEVASIKPSAPPESNSIIVRMGVPQPGGGWVATNATLDQMIRSAYPGHGLEAQLVGGPGWVRSDKYDVNAKAVGNPTREQVTEMARALLADRFKLRLHAETRSLRGYRLVYARSDRRLGSGLKLPALDCVAVRAAAASGTADAGDAVACVVMTTHIGPITRLNARSLSIGGFANLLSSNIGGRVVDETGLATLFDISLEFASDVRVATGPADASADTPSVFTAIQEQLGLRLESSGAATEILVIDSVERPSPN